MEADFSGLVSAASAATTAASAAATESATTATSAATTESAASTSAAAASTAAAETTGTGFLGLSFVYGQSASFDFFAIELRNSGLGFLIRRHFHESETLGATTVTIGD